MTRRLGLPAPVTVTDDYLAALLAETVALRAAIDGLAERLAPETKPARKRPTTKE
ncbi:MAG: hypothetical protein V9F06_07470 [Thermomicrobiales bacterium]